ncbi:MAG TPA: aspartate kinase [Bacillota bacterium]|jgi:aspartate kinase|nr:aspartate kinase [Bacillota bacterium]HOJ84125.1 aspartate kinase [Bacillota bacterium]HOL15299.1 aspartate kinase [Bacillota bacterium]HPZ12209.1 aspartate kinase [Bacillota bacterium]HQE10489.1 aspartate kinase [Bacillota bacterium]
MNIIVQKFGGTSTANERVREAVVRRIRQALAGGYKPVAVVSAMGRAGDPYATDTIKKLAENIFPQAPLRELDLIMHCGEIIAAVVMAATLHKAGIKARAFTGYQAGLTTDGCYGQARVVACNPERIRRCLQGGEVAVVAGFQGLTPDGEINTLGRGGSDTTAVILGAALQAELVELYTDVNGIATADPHILKEARVISQMTYSEACQLVYEGSRVIHPPAVELAMKYNLNLVVRSLTEESSGTLINSGIQDNDTAAAGFTHTPRRVVTGIAHAADIVQLVIEFNQPDPDLEIKLFESLAGAGISIDLISVFPNRKIFTIKEEALPRASAVLNELGIDFSVEKDCAKVSVIGFGMRGIPGVMARVVRALNEKGISILQTADSNISISLLIRRPDLAAAVRTLHDHFALGIADLTAGETNYLHEKMIVK